MTIVYKCEKKDFFFIALSWLFFRSTNFHRRTSPQIRELTCMCVRFLCIPTWQKETFHDVCTVPRLRCPCIVWTRLLLNLTPNRFLAWAKCFSFSADCLLCVSLCRMWSVSFGNQSFVLAKLSWDATRSLERHTKVVVLWTTLYLLLCLFVEKLRPFEGPYFGTWQTCFCEVLLSRQHCV